MTQSARSEENSDCDSDDATRLANGPERSLGDKGLGASGAEGVADPSDPSDPSDTRLANGPVQPTPGVDGLGAEGSTG